MITVARFTPLADLVHAAPSAVITVALFAAAIVAFGPGLFALLRLINRMPQQRALIARLVDEEAPRPDGPA